MFLKNAMPGAEMPGLFFRSGTSSLKPWIQKEACKWPELHERLVPIEDWHSAADPFWQARPDGGAQIEEALARIRIEECDTALIFVLHSGPSFWPNRRDFPLADAVRTHAQQIRDAGIVPGCKVKAYRQEHREHKKTRSQEMHEAIFLGVSGHNVQVRFAERDEQIIPGAWLHREAKNVAHKIVQDLANAFDGSLGNGISYDDRVERSDLLMPIDFARVAVVFVDPLLLFDMDARKLLQRALERMMPYLIILVPDDNGFLASEEDLAALFGRDMSEYPFRFTCLSEQHVVIEAPRIIHHLLSILSHENGRHVCGGREPFSYARHWFFCGMGANCKLAESVVCPVGQGSVRDDLDVFAPQVVVCSEKDDTQLAEQVRKHIKNTTAARSLHITVNSEVEEQGDVRRRAVEKAVCVVLVLPRHYSRFMTSLFDDEGNGVGTSSSSALTWRKLLVLTRHKQIVPVMTPHSLALSTLLTTVRCTYVRFFFSTIYCVSLMRFCATHDLQAATMQSVTRLPSSDAAILLTAVLESESALAAQMRALLLHSSPCFSGVGKGGQSPELDFGEFIHAVVDLSTPWEESSMELSFQVAVRLYAAGRTGSCVGASVAPTRRDRAT